MYRKHRKAYIMVLFWWSMGRKDFFYPTNGQRLVFGLPGYKYVYIYKYIHVHLCCKGKNQQRCVIVQTSFVEFMVLSAEWASFFGPNSFTKELQCRASGYLQGHCLHHKNMCMCMLYLIRVQMETEQRERDWRGRKSEGSLMINHASHLIGEVCGLSIWFYTCGCPAGS